MTYKLKYSYDNGYNCGCCNRVYNEEEKFETLEELEERLSGSDSFTFYDGDLVDIEIVETKSVDTSAIKNYELFYELAKINSGISWRRGKDISISRHKMSKLYSEISENKNNWKPEILEAKQKEYDDYKEERLKLEKEIKEYDSRKKEIEIKLGKKLEEENSDL